MSTPGDYYERQRHLASFYRNLLAEFDALSEVLGLDRKEYPLSATRGTILNRLKAAEYVGD